MKNLIPLLVCLIYWPLLIFAQVAPDTAQIVIPNRENDVKQQQKPYVILISIDGFRWDYADKYHAENLLKFSEKGVRAVSMIPSYPSFTFPNHYTLVTGMVPSRHGLIANHFYDAEKEAFYSIRDPKALKDGSWYGGIPLWTLAEQQKMLTASYFWAGSEAEIGGWRPSYYYPYNEITPMDRRIGTVRRWLELPAGKRPHLIHFYFPEVDHAGHRYGPDSPETKRAVLRVDSCIGALAEEVMATGLPVNFLVVSDHGMTEIDTGNPLRLPAGFDREKFIIPPGGEVIHLFAKERKDILPAYELLSSHAEFSRVYLREDLPGNLVSGDSATVRNRFGDIVLISEWPRVFNLSSRRTLPGGHGFDPTTVKDMHTIFYAWGPHIKENIEVSSFPNTDVFPLVAALLELRFDHFIDGTDYLIRRILRENSE